MTRMKQSTFINASECSSLQLLNAVYKDSHLSSAAMNKRSSYMMSPSTSSSYNSFEPKFQLRRNVESPSLTVLRCNSETNESLGNSSVDEDELQVKLNEEYLVYLSKHFRCMETTRQFRKNRNQCYPWDDSRLTKYHEHLSDGIRRFLINADNRTMGDLGCCGIGKHQASDDCLALKSDLYHQYCPGAEIYSRKVFIGGLPIDVDQDELISTFSRFGPLIVDWPNKTENKNFYPPKGYVFLIFASEYSVRLLCQACFVVENKLLLYLTSPSSPDKMIQVRPWKLADADYVAQPHAKISQRRAVFVGGVPRPIKAVELAHILDRLYGSVAYASIDLDIPSQYPTGAGRVVFFSNKSFVKAIGDRYVKLSHGDIEKKVELKPYVLDDQVCDECRGECAGNQNRFAPFFCPNLACLQYYCETCWTSMHSQSDFEHHKPLVKEA